MAKRPSIHALVCAGGGRHLDRIESKCHGLLRRAIREQLTTHPGRGNQESETFGTAGSVRLPPGNFVAVPTTAFRVFYDVDSDSQTVLVLAIGVKDRNRLLFGTEEYQS